MAREEILWCDICLSEDDAPRVEARERVHQIGQFKRAMDLCERHDKEISTVLDNIVAMMRNFGRDPDKAPKLVAPRAKAAAEEPRRQLRDRSGDRVPCPKCSKTVVNVSALRGHLSGPHHLSDEEVEEIAPRLGTLCGCGKEFNAPQGLANHMDTYGHKLPSGKVPYRGH